MSSRDPDDGVNVGLFTPKAFAKNKPDINSFQTCQCIADHRVVEFMRTNAIEIETCKYSIDMFMVDGVLPFPACQGNSRTAYRSNKNN
jgi:hypothetical protein